MRYFVFVFLFMSAVRKHKLFTIFFWVVVAGVVQHVWAAVVVGSTWMVVLIKQPK